MSHQSSEAERFQPRPKREGTADSRAGWSLTPRLRQQITQRLQLIAITYSLAYFIADFVTPTLTRHLGDLLADPKAWMPGVGSIVAGLTVAFLASLESLSWRAKLD